MLLRAAALAAVAVSPLAETRAAPTAGPTLKQQAGQRIVFGFDGTSAPERLLKRIHRGEAGGVILFSRNISSRKQLRSLTKSLQDAVPAGDPPLIVSIDQEGGLVKRLSGAPEHSAAELGRRNDTTLARHEGRDTAKNLLGVGVNVNLAPVVDVARSGSIMEEQGRSYSGDATRVVRIAGAFARGLANNDVAATAKHFPGLGGATVNTDDGPSTIRTPVDRDLVPFRAAVGGAVPLVMLSHASYPALDSHRIASQSRAIATGLLRRRLGFGGVIVTDSLEAPAVLARSGVAPAAERSIRAGADLILMTGSASWNDVYPHLLAVARRERAFRERIRDAAARVLVLKKLVG
jgi:beta-N-acetylhexosaminidase